MNKIRLKIEKIIQEKEGHIVDNPNTVSAIIDAIKEMVPEEIDLTKKRDYGDFMVKNGNYAMGFNEARRQFLDNLQK